VASSEYQEMNKYEWTVDVLRDFWYCRSCKAPVEKNSVFRGRYVCSTCFIALVNPVRDCKHENGMFSYEVDAALRAGVKVRRKSWPEGSSIRMDISSEIHVEGSVKTTVYDPFAADWEIVQ